MSRSIALYLLTTALLSLSLYLHSPTVALSIVALWGVRAAEDVLTRKNKDADIEEMKALLTSHKAKLAGLEQQITNVHDRARTILGENF